MDLDVADRLTEVGFSVEILDMEKLTEAALAERYRLHNNLNIRELIFYCTK
jgi:hypothetical protein